MTKEEFMRRLAALGFTDEQVRSLSAPPIRVSVEELKTLKAIPVGSGSFDFDPAR